MLTQKIIINVTKTNIKFILNYLHQYLDVYQNHLIHLFHIPIA